MSIDGVCQTVVRALADRFDVEATGETLQRTTLARWSGPRKVNLERAVVAHGRLDGHIVLGHVDGEARLIGRREESNGVWFDLKAPHELQRFIASQGSVALDGVSLTVASVRAHVFSVSVVPHTLAKSILGAKRHGDYLNLEVDVLARYVDRNLSAGPASDHARRHLNEWI